LFDEIEQQIVYFVYFVRQQLSAWQKKFGKQFGEIGRFTLPQKYYVTFL